MADLSGAKPPASPIVLLHDRRFGPEIYEDLAATLQHDGWGVLTPSLDRSFSMDFGAWASAASRSLQDLKSAAGVVASGAAAAPGVDLAARLSAPLVLIQPERQEPLPIEVLENPSPLADGPKQDDIDAYGALVQTFVRQGTFTPQQRPAYRDALVALFAHGLPPRGRDLISNSISQYLDDWISLLTPDSPLPQQRGGSWEERLRSNATPTSLIRRQLPVGRYQEWYDEPIVAVSGHVVVIRQDAPTDYPWLYDPKETAAIIGDVTSSR